jgi:hypothetical protein
MTLSMYDASMPAFTQMLGALSGVLDKAAAHAEAKKIDPAVLPATRLVADMMPLTRQVQIACDFAKGTMARLAGAEVPSYPDSETTVPELKARIDKTLAFIATLDRAAIEASADRDITVKAGPREMHFKGKPYLVGFALPNFYFHVTMAYAILRANGVDLGKFDYMGMKPPA